MVTPIPIPAWAPIGRAPLVLPDDADGPPSGSDEAVSTPAPLVISAETHRSRFRFSGSAVKTPVLVSTVVDAHGQRIWSLPRTASHGCFTSKEWKLELPPISPRCRARRHITIRTFQPRRIETPTAEGDSAIQVCAWYAIVAPEDSWTATSQPAGYVTAVVRGPRLDRLEEVEAMAANGHVVLSAQQS
ncbi:hypothetical protein DL765_002906 [Monosporascus sp. GIB2]|nr:hypothetical protein DL765_002906 [Monosporascus sp. GIB2]